MKFYFRCILLFLIFFSLFAAQVWAQTITIGNVDPGPYAPGSSIAVPIHIDNTNGCIPIGNQFKLYLSNAAGNFPAIFPNNSSIGSFSGFYATFVNGILPSNLTPGTNYKLGITLSSVPNTVVASIGITIVAGTAVQAGISSATPPINTAYPDVLGNCTPNTSNSFIFNDASTAGATVTANFHDEYVPNATADVNINVVPNSSFTPDATNYTILVTATKNGVTGTHAYMFVNNAANTSFGTIGTASACQNTNLTFTVDVGSSSGLQHNFPGNIYVINWGDGSPAQSLTYCDLAGGSVNHTYLNSSCGSVVDGQKNVFKVNFTNNSPYCGIIGSVNTNVSISTPPVNIIDNTNPYACSGVVTFTNKTSIPGNDPNAPAGTCVSYAGALYVWYVRKQGQNTIIAQSPAGGISQDVAFSPTLASGQYTITLHYANDPATVCHTADATFDICVQDPPKPKFTLPVTSTCVGTSVTPTDLSVLDQNCNNANTYVWTVTPSTFSYLNGTNANSKQPQFKFNAAGTYQIKLGITTPNCGLVETLQQQVTVNGPPVVTFSGATNFCGPQPITFDNSRITYAGTAGGTVSYLWTVTPQGGAAPATFVNGTTASQQHPQINFPSVGDYTVSVTYTNSCGISAPVSQTISIKQAPTVSANATHTTICVGDPVNLNGSITASSPYTILWSDNGIGGTFSPNNTILNPVYTPSTGKTGPITLTINVLTTSLPSPCNDVTVDVPVTITHPPSGSNISETICYGSQLNHTISSSNSDDTYTWAVNPVNVNNVANYTVNGNGALIQDNLTLVNTGATGTITYTITPYNSNGCPGAAFTYTVTVNPLPVINLPANVSLCSGSVVSSVINLAAGSNLPNTIYTWSASVTSANPANVNGYTQNNSASANISDVLNNTGTTAETVTYVFTPIAGSCPGAPVSVNITVEPQPTQAIADVISLHQQICDQPSFQLNANTPTVGNGAWAQTSGPTTGVLFANINDPHTSVSGLSGGNTYQFTWTISSGCGSSAPSTVTVIDNPSTVAGTASPVNNPVCAGVNGDVTLSGMVGTVSRWETSIDNGNTWNAIASTIGQNLTTYTYQGIAYNNNVPVLFRAIVQSGNCSPPLSSVAAAVTVLTGLSNNNITNTGAPEICYNTTPAGFTGTLPQGGDGNYTYRWQQSNDGVNFNDITTGNYSSRDYQPPALTVTTYFRRVVTSALCTGNTSSISAPVMIKVDPAIQATFTAVITTSCPSFNIGQNNNITVTADTDPNVTYQWTINDGATTQQFTGANFPGYTITEAGKSVDVTLVATNAHGCQRTTSVTFSTATQITSVLALSNPSASSGCADAGNKFTVVFKNMSTPSGGNFTWNFGDGSPVYVGPDLQLNHDFTASTDGSDKIYTVTLSPQSSCTNNISSTQIITVYPAKPVPAIEIDHTDGCSGVSIVVHNKTLGTNDSYTYYLRDENNTVVQTITRTSNDKSDVTFNPVFAPNNFVTYTVMMTAVNLCGASANSNIKTLNVSPSNISAAMSVTPVQQSTHTVAGCAPFQVTFHNTSFGGTAYTYHIFKDGVQQPDVRDDRPAVDYTFLEPGTYTVSLNVSSTCATGVESAPVTVTVNALPAPDFTASAATCSQPFVQFTNNTLNENNLPANSYSYLWDFGDGITSDQYLPPPHNYSADHSPYTVKLTATNNNGCSFTTTKVAYVVVNAPPGTDFAVRPDTTISIPNYRFSFEDESASAVSWSWDFGDNTISTEQNPAHTYADTGAYKVTLISTSAAGCSDSKIRTVHITGVPGQLYVPNAFMPTSLNTELRVFTVKGSGIKQWDMRIYNSWGGLIFETTKLNDRGEPTEFWDGRYKGQDLQQGGYAWEISATFKNGTDWKGMSYKAGSPPKKAGIVNLIR